MTKDREFKDRVRARMEATGESYSTARSMLDTRSSSMQVKRVIPTLQVTSWETAREHYVDWLGFSIDWEWRQDPHSPVIASLSRDGMSMMIMDGQERGVGGTWLVVHVPDLHQLVEEWNERRPGSAEIIIEPPYDIPSAPTYDPDGNFIDWQEPVSDAEEQARAARRVEMHAFVTEQLAAGEPIPTPDDLIGRFGRPRGLAVDVLNEFPEYEAATRPPPD